MKADSLLQELAAYWRIAIDSELFTERIKNLCEKYPRIFDAVEERVFSQLVNLIPTESYISKNPEATREWLNKIRLRARVGKHISDGNFDAANKTYLYCCEWWDQSDYDSLVKNKKNRIATETQERLAREADERVRATKEAEAEKVRQQQARLRQAAIEKRHMFLDEINTRLKQDFLAAESFFKSHSNGIVSEHEFESGKLTFVHNWFEGRSSALIHANIFLPDQEQLSAIATVNCHVQVVARAGSGKTATLVNRAFFLQKHCRVDPSEIMLLAFNRKAAEEMEQRLSALLDGQAPFVMTFHALAHSLVHPEQNMLIDSSDGRNQALSRFVQEVIDARLRDPAFNERIRKVMVAHFKEDWDRIEEGGYHLSKEKMLEYRRSLQRETLRGEFVKSHGEKVIANFLFEHQVPYYYEPIERNDKLKNYHPDFLLKHGDGTGIAIEYFGMTGDPDYDEMSNEKRRYWACKPRWELIEVFPSDIAQDNLEHLRNQIEEKGFVLRRMTEDEIWHQIAKRSIDRFSLATRNFIGRCRKMELTPESLQQKISQHKTNIQVEADFLDIMTPIYRDYIDCLEADDKEDFDGLMQRATQALNDGKTAFSRYMKKQHGDLTKLRFMLIDEYQDFSKLFHSMIDAIRRINPELQLFCVGDDWQAINGFAGSDLIYHQHFSTYFPAAKRLHISTNYRSASDIVGIGNAVMMERDKHGKPAMPHSAARKGNIWLAEVTAFASWRKSSEEARHGDDYYTPMVLRLAKHTLDQDKDIVLLSRTNNPPGYINYTAYQGDESQAPSVDGIDRFARLIRSYFPKHLHPRIKVSTTHGFKGLQGSVVVILDAVAGCYPLIHQDWIFLRLLGETVEAITDEARRLFYVALTRAVDTLVIITEQNKKSPFLEDIEGKSSLPPISWSAFPAVSAKSDRLVVMLGNHLWERKRDKTPTHGIRDLLKQEKYTYRPGAWPCWMKSFSAENFSIKLLVDSPWYRQAEGVEVRVFDEQDNLVESLLIDKGTWINLKQS